MNGTVYTLVESQDDAKDVIRRVYRLLDRGWSLHPHYVDLPGARTARYFQVMEMDLDAFEERARLATATSSSEERIKAGELTRLTFDAPDQVDGVGGVQ